MMTLAIRYDVALPERGNDWRSWQNEKGRRRQALRDVLAESYRRRYFRAYYSGYLQSVDLELREAEARQIWEDLWPMALLCADQRFSA
jgi:hypothetical protein